MPFPFLHQILRFRAWILLGLTILLVFTVRLRLREMPLERDEGEYAFAGQLILQGVPPYKEAYNMKLPGTYAAYAVIMAVLGQSAAGIHVGLLIVNGASIVMLFLLGRKLLDDAAGVAAAVSFALLSLSPSTLGLAAHSSHFVTFFALAGTLVLVSSVGCQGVGDREQKSEGRGQKSEVRSQTLNSQLFNPQLFFSGILFGLAFVMDQHGVFFIIFGGLYLVYQLFGRRVQSQRREERRDSVSRSHAPTLRLSDFPRAHALRSTLLFTAGCILPYLMTCLILLLAGVFPRFVFWTISYASKYAGANPMGMAPEMLKAALRYVLGMDALLWLLPWAGALVMWQIVDGRWERGDSKEKEEVREQRSESRGQTRARTEDERRTSSVEHPTSNAASPSHPAFAKALRLGEQGEGESAFKVRSSMLAAPKSDAGGFDVRCSFCSILLSPIPDPRFFLTALLLCSIGAVSVGYYFRSHYFIMALPALVLLSGVAVSRGWHLVKHDRSIELFLAVPILGLFLIGIGATLVGNGDIWFRLAPAAAVREIYGTTLFSEAMEVAGLIKDDEHRTSNIEHPTLNSPLSGPLPARSSRGEGKTAGPEKRVAVIGSEPELYFYCHARSATGYLYTYPLMEPQPFALKMQEEMISEIETNRPEYVIYVNDDRSWLRQPDSEKRIDEWWENYWTRNLDLVRTIEIHGREGASEPPVRKEMLIMKRRGG